MRQWQRVLSDSNKYALRDGRGWNEKAAKGTGTLQTEAPTADGCAFKEHERFR